MPVFVGTLALSALLNWHFSHRGEEDEWKTWEAGGRVDLLARVNNALAL